MKATILWSLIASMLAFSGRSSDVSITVTLRDQSGTPIVGIPFRASSESKLAFAKTDDTGSAKMQLAELEDGACVLLRFEDGVEAKWNQSEREIARHNVTKLLSSFYCPFATIEMSKLVIQTKPSISSYSVDLVVSPAVVARGRVVDARGLRPPENAVVSARYSNNLPVATDRNGQFELRGLPAGRSNEIFAATSRGIGSCFVGENEAGQPITIAEIRLPEWPETLGRLALSCKNPASLRDSSGLVVGAGTTLVRNDGTMYSCFIGEGGHMELLPGKFPNIIPVGKYFVVPGMFRASELQLAVRDAVVRGDDLDDSGVPTVTVLSDELTTFEYDSDAAAAAIRKKFGLSQPPLLCEERKAQETSR